MFTANQNQGPSLLGVFVVWVCCLVAPAAPAALLPPGGTLTLRAAHEPDDGHLLAATNFTLTSAAFTGTLTSQVWAQDESNPWGGLTFIYRLVNRGDCRESLGLFTLGGFANSLVDVNYSGFGIAPRSATRSLSGETISFGFFDCHGDETLRAGCTSAWLVLQTDDHTWGLNPLVGMDSVSVRAAIFAPLTVPEPSPGTMASLAGLALLVLVARRRRR